MKTLEVIKIIATDKKYTQFSILGLRYNRLQAIEEMAKMGLKQEFTWKLEEGTAKNILRII